MMEGTASAPGRDARERCFAEGAAEPLAGGPTFTLGSLVLSSPVMPASGCFGPELGHMIPVGELGAAVTKTVFATPRSGNPAPRVSDTASGLVNSIGIPSLGPEWYLHHLHGAYEGLGIPTIISVGGHRIHEFAEVVTRLEGAGAAYEINVSCPNLDAHGVEIGADPRAIQEVVTRVRAATTLPVIVKLAPMVASIADCAQAATDAGADALCVANSLPCLPLDPKTLAPVLGNRIGGLTGRSLRPLILRLVALCAQRVEVPIIGCGGVHSASDALEYFAVGASAVQVGTATLGAPDAMVQIARGLRTMSAGEAQTRVADLVAKARAAAA